LQNKTEKNPFGQKRAWENIREDVKETVQIVSIREELAQEKEQSRKDYSRRDRVARKVEKEPRKGKKNLHHLLKNFSLLKKKKQKKYSLGKMNPKYYQGKKYSQKKMNQKY